MGINLKGRKFHQQVKSFAHVIAIVCIVRLYGAFRQHCNLYQSKSNIGGNIVMTKLKGHFFMMSAPSSPPIKESNDDLGFRLQPRHHDKLNSLVDKIPPNWVMIRINRSNIET
ncbi:Hypothetical predicted protein [Olea europaea subsp. europaea]|uniref:Uncharacterized protein n=1 Tax=Olea europaea subsp. europaea TaxID=158383 RepID=A0A8S0VJV1_OLEEU|nr:Hypothetical predicted protein [Olea europaea subsp. europaea]